MEIYIKFIKHINISQSEVTQICELKATRWNYSFKEHKKWMKANLQAEDFHVLFFVEDSLIAYANIVNTNALINGSIIGLKGVGNVCTRKSGEGFGKILMDGINNEIIKRDWQGILICKDQLIEYYQKFGWVLVKNDESLTSEQTKINFLTYNLKVGIQNFEFVGRNF